MDEKSNPGVDAGLAKAREAMGMMDGAKDPSLDIQPDDEKSEEQGNEPKAPAKPEAKTESKDEDESEEDESEDEEDDEAKGEEDESDQSSDKPPAKHKPSVFEKAAFTQIGELRKLVTDLTKTVSTFVEKGGAKAEAAVEAAGEAVSDAVTALMKEAEEKGSDPNFVKKLATTLRVDIEKDLESKGLLRKDLPTDVQEKLKLLDDIQKERAEQSQASSFGNEWDVLVPTLQKEFPNAGANELAAARKLMDEISHSAKGGVVLDEKKAIIKGYPLDFILHQNRKAFEAILKIAKGNKSGEGESHEIKGEEENEEEELNLDPENMTPDKFRKLQKQRVKDSEDEQPLQFIG